MNRKPYVDYIVKKLSHLVCEVEVRGRLNLLDLNIHAEAFFMHFLNLIFGYNLQNANVIQQNSESIDLVDHSKKIIIQVSSTATKQKIESTFEKDLSAYDGYSFYFMFIVNNAVKVKNLKIQTTPRNISFYNSNIYDIKNISDKILNMQIEELEAIYDLVKKELHFEDFDQNLVETNIAEMIGIISQKDFNVKYSRKIKFPYDPNDKILYNKLVINKGMIERHKRYYSMLSNLYSEYDKLGNNKSITVFNVMSTFYDQAINLEPDERFSHVVSETIKKIESSSNYSKINSDYLEYCVQMLVVDAFIRCEIFENPPKK